MSFTHQITNIHKSFIPDIGIIYILSSGYEYPPTNPKNRVAIKKLELLYLIGYFSVSEEDGLLGIEFKSKKQFFSEAIEKLVEYESDLSN